MSEQIIEIPLVDLHDSPTNPRQSYAEAGLQELAADIRQHGRVLQPLLVRPRVPALFQGSGEEEAATCGYEVVFGHRRRRAAELAGLEKVHCMVRVMTDVQVRAAQISENLQRQDVTALEEAEGYRGLIDAECISVDEVCRRFGKSTTYVYGRLKLLNLVPEVRQALAAGEVEPEVATLIARLPHQKLQAQALTRIKNHMGESHIKDGGKASFRRVRELLRDEFTLRLKDAIFPTDKADLLPDCGDCISCPRRSGNAPEFADVASEKKESWSNAHVGADVCTDPACFDRKRQAWLKLQAAELRAKGQEVIDGNKAKAALGARGEVKGGFVAVQDVKALINQHEKSVKKGQAIAAAPQPVLLQNQRDGKTVKAYRLSDLQKAGIELDHADKPATAARQSGPTYEERTEQARVEGQRREARLLQIRGMARLRERTADELRLVLEGLLATGVLDLEERRLLNSLWSIPTPSGWFSADDLMPAWSQRLRDMNRDELALLLLDLALLQGIRPGPYSFDEPATILDTWEQYYATGTLPALAASTPPPAGASSVEDDADAEETPPDADPAEPSQPHQPAAAGGVEAPSRFAPAWPFPRPRRGDEAQGDLLGSASEDVKDATGCAGEEQTDEASSAGQNQTDDAGVAAGGSNAEVQA